MAKKYYRKAKQIVNKKTGKFAGYKVVDTGKKTASQAHREAMQDLKNQRYKMNVSEVEKTKRSAARAAAASTTVSNTVAQAEMTKREQAKQKSQQVASQYAALINGNQGNPNAAKPEDSTGTKQSEWTAIPLN